MILRTRLLCAVVAFVVLSVGLSPPVGAVPIQPAQAAAVTVVGAVNGVLQIASAGSSLDVTVALRSQQAPKTVTAQISAFRNADGENFAATAGNPVKFDGRLGAVRITASLPYGGPFFADLVITHDGVADDPVTLSVTRTRKPVAVTVEGVPTTSAISTGWHRQTVHRSVLVTETSGRPVTIGPLEVVNSSRKQGDQTLNADITITGLTTSGPADVCTVDAARRSFTVEPGRACRLDVTIELPATPATYDMAVRYAAAGSGPVDEKLTVQLRRAASIAVSVIALGVAIAILLAYVLRPRRERQRVQLDVSRVRMRLISTARREAGLTPDAEEKAQIEGLHLVLDGVHEEAGTDATRASTKLGVAEWQIDQLGPWIALHRALRAADPPADAATMRNWQKVTNEIIDADLSEERAKAIAGQLSAIQKLLDDAAKRVVTAQIRRLRSALPELGVAATADVGGLLEQAEAALAAEPPALAVAVAHLTTAQTLVGDTAEQRLRALARRDAAALGMPVDPAAWSAVQTQVMGLLQEARTAEPARKLTLLQAAEKALIAGSADAFADYVKDVRDKYRSSGASDKEQEFASRFNPVVDTLDSVTEAVRSGDLADARRVYGEALEQWRALDQEVEDEFGTHLGPTKQPVDPPEIPPDVIPTPVSVRRDTVGSSSPAAARPSPSDLRKKRRRTELVLVLVAGGVAVLLGLTTLYLGRPTWGGPVDMITAVLWGLGVTAAAGTAGFSAVQSDIMK